MSLHSPSLAVTEANDKGLQSYQAVMMDNFVTFSYVTEVDLNRQWF